MTTRSALLTRIAIFIVGVGCGALLYSVINAASSRNAAVLFVDVELNTLESVAINAFAKNDPKVAVFAQEVLIRFAEDARRADLLPDRKYFRTVGMANARIGLLHSEMGDAGRSTEILKEALTVLENGGVGLTERQLLESLRKYRSENKNK